MQENTLYFERVNHWALQMIDFVKQINSEMDEERITVLERLNKLEKLTNDTTYPNMRLIQEMEEEMKKIQRNVELLCCGKQKPFRSRIPIGEHSLPSLPYDYNALEPYISTEIMKLHHTKHHQSYVDGLNNAEIKLKEAREIGDFTLIKHWERELAFHGSGHYLHCIFWEVMSPKGSKIPKGSLLKQIEMDFSSFTAFKKHFTEAANQVEGVGWALLVWSPRSHRLEILQSEKHQLFTQWDTIPLLVLDVWEHAYYLQYKNNRKDYVNKWWNVVNWKNVEDRFNKAVNIKWKSF
ncbi:superoxide dismutase [Bacillus timonensis]|nr:superoxide dismutase [Bacillus timonensis]